VAQVDNINVIAFDADDTLWVNEPIYRKTEEQCKQILEPYLSPPELSEKLYETEMKNLKLFGYGIKSFTLSLIETAIELSDNQVSAGEIQKIIDLGKEMRQHPVELLPGVEETLRELEDEYKLMVLTKGDLLDQESKIARSGLDPHFDYIEIVSDKSTDTYSRLLSHYSIEPSNFLMVGNSLKSDVLPVCKIGGHAIHIPYHITWDHEEVDPDEAQKDGYHELDDISQLPDFLNRSE